MSSQDQIDDLARLDGYDDKPKTIYIYAPAIYGSETVREEFKETLQNHFEHIYVVEDDDEENVIIVNYYSDEGYIDEDKVLDVVVADFDGSAYRRD